MSTVTTKNKQTIILEAIKAGGATRESLMQVAGINKAGFASQLAYLNSRGLSMAEVDKTKAEFPMVGENGVYFMGTYEQYEAKRRNATSGFTAKPKTKQEVLDAAQKREDKASSAYSKAEQKAKDNPSDAIFAKIAEIRKAEMELASMKLSRAQAGDFSYEAATIVEGDEPANTPDPSASTSAKGSKKGAQPGSEDALV